MDKTLRRRGYSLIEVLLAISIITIAILALVALFTKGLKLKTKMSQVTVATELGREVIERTKSIGFSNLPAPGSIFDGSVPTPITAAGFPPAPYPQMTIDDRQYVVSVTVTELPGRSRVRCVLVEVSWGDNSKVKLATRLVDL